jgi:UDP-glucose 4-epimerase
MYPADRATYYLSSKLVGELFVEHLRRSRHMQSLCLRISSLFGLGMSPKSVVARFMESAYRGLPLEVFDAGISTYDFVYVKDIANLIVEALKIGEPGIYNVGSGTAHSILELAQAVIDLFPERKLSINIKPSYGPIPASFSALCIDKAIRTWNFRPHTLFEGLTEYRNQMEQKIGDYRNNE